MAVQINGERRALPAPLSVAALLTELGIDARLVAVELNRVVVKRAHYPTTMVRDDDEVEIVAFVGGGCAGIRPRVGRLDSVQRITRKWLHRVAALFPLGGWRSACIPPPIERRVRGVID